MGGELKWNIMKKEIKSFLRKLGITAVTKQRCYAFFGRSS
jgi:hypothetical protein